MPFISGEEHQALLDRVNQLEDQLRNYEKMGQVITWASMLHETMVDLIEQPLSAGEVADLALKRTIEKQREGYRASLVEEYEEAHREELYRQALAIIDQEEGETISADVRRRVETDPELAASLLQSARREVASKALESITHEITAEQAAIIEQEAQRQLELDKLDVEFVIDGEIDLFRTDVLRLLKPGDQLNITYLDYQDREKVLTVQWENDVNSDEGWVMMGQQYFYESRPGTKLYLSLDLDPNKFIFLGSMQIDRTQGQMKAIPEVIKKDEPLIFYQYEAKDRKRFYNPGTRHPGSITSEKPREAVVTKIDFRTRALHF